MLVYIINLYSPFFSLFVLVVGNQLVAMYFAVWKPMKINHVYTNRTRNHGLRARKAAG
jgi:hypothetical protein